MALHLVLQRALVLLQQPVEPLELLQRALGVGSGLGLGLGLGFGLRAVPRQLGSARSMEAVPPSHLVRVRVGSGLVLS